MKLSRRRLLGTGLAIAGPAAAWAQAVPPPSDEARAPALPSLGTPLALAATPLLGGGAFDPAQAQGRVLVLYWWASWCPFCAVQSPHVEKLWQAQRSRGLQILALSIDRQPEAAATYLKNKGYTFPAALLTPALARVLPKPKGLPVTVVRGRDGKVVFAEAGEMFPEDVEGLAKYL